MQRRRCGMRGQRRRRATPPFTIHRVPSERSRRRTSCATERRCLASPLLPCPLHPCPLLSSVSLHLVVVFRRTLRAAHGIAVEVARSPARIIDVRARRTSCSDQTRVDQRT